jgi:hypothetical protein
MYLPPRRYDAPFIRLDTSAAVYGDEHHEHGMGAAAAATCCEG